jgi:hypothetical protein
MGYQMSQCMVESFASQAILERLWRDPVGFFKHLIIMDETWFHMHDPETKEHSKEGMLG